MPSVVLGVSGSVAAYRAADLARELMRSGFTVRACLTDSAAKFVTPALFEALTGQPCLADTFEEPIRGRMAHIDWARQADAIVVAPASANVLAKLAHGIADDMLSTIALAHTGRLILAPAMNPAMYDSDPVRSALEVLRARAAVIVEPDEGEVACGEQGQGKLASVAKIAEAVDTVARAGTLLSGQKVLITSGPTQEPFDRVRFLTNRSSGKMGSALARAALLLGAEVTVIHGPQREPIPIGARAIPVNTAREMEEAAFAAAPGHSWIIGAAAVADYRFAQIEEGKHRRTGEPIQVTLVPNPDVLAGLAHRADPGTKLIGFAAEPSSELDVARRKLAAKGLWAIAANDVSVPGIGFDSDANALTIVFADGVTVESGRRSKLGCALFLWETCFARQLNSRL